MTKKDIPISVCPICTKSFPTQSMIKGVLVRPAVAKLIVKDHPDWNADSLICKPDLNHYRALMLEQILEEEKGELSALDREVVESIKNQELASANLNEVFQVKPSFGGRLADKIAEFGGSWRFIILFGLVLFIWISSNLYLLSKPFDVYPFIFLNLILSCVAAIQAPVIMMSQNRQETKDRIRSEQDYRINLKAELEIRALHEKFDHILIQQWERMLSIQQMQVDIMEELSAQNN